MSVCSGVDKEGGRQGVREGREGVINREIKKDGAGITRRLIVG